MFRDIDGQTPGSTVIPDQVLMKAKAAMVSGVEIYPTGAILGKALEALPAGSGVIKVLVTLK